MNVTWGAHGVMPKRAAPRARTLLRIHTSSGSYPLVADTPALDWLRAWRLARAGSGSGIAVVTDAVVARACAGVIERAFGGLPLLAVPAGEASKTLVQMGTVLEFLAQAGLDRAGTVVAFGGGVVGDLAGFAAATYLRGVRLLQVPTTLLAMVDSSVGGKTGVNLEAGKNLAGAFHQPTAVVLVPGLLETLPPREFAAGMAEVIKYGLLADACLFSLLERRPLRGPADERLPALIRRCCAIKAAVVAEDERELRAESGRALLNLGHTFGHAIEKVAGYGAYLHGEAVAIGLVGAALLSASLGLTQQSLATRIGACLRAHGLPQRLREPLPTTALLDAMGRDKKARAGRLRFVLLERPGRAVTRAVDDTDTVAAVLAHLGAS